MKKGNAGMSFVGMDEIEKLLEQSKIYKEAMYLLIDQKDDEIAKKVDMQMEPLREKIKVYDLLICPHVLGTDLNISIYLNHNEGKIKIEDYEITKVTLEHEKLDEVLKIVNEFLDELKESDK